MVVVLTVVFGHDLRQQPRQHASSEKTRFEIQQQNTYDPIHTTEAHEAEWCPVSKFTTELQIDSVLREVGQASNPRRLSYNTRQRSATQVPEIFSTLKKKDRWLTDGQPQWISVSPVLRGMCPTPIDPDSQTELGKATVVYCFASVERTNREREREKRENDRLCWGTIEQSKGERKKWLAVESEE